MYLYHTQVYFISTNSDKDPTQKPYDPNVMPKEPPGCSYPGVCAATHGFKAAELSQYTRVIFLGSAGS